ncbi:unnamed protein product [Plutella xylostella]|uniref:(diamondback moth) hypothetical protein n=1 Tax=Plutella xylostella TaxID=51655 RepID=A0A8S4FDT3_PLUXY|nr:unnamed protein product [Plutella xylostella]
MCRTWYSLGCAFARPRSAERAAADDGAALGGQLARRRAASVLVGN